MQEKLLRRDEFIKILFKKSASLAERFTADIYDAFKKAEDTTEELLSIRVLPIKEFVNNPLLITSTQPPLFLIGNIEKKVIAVSALCPQEQFLLCHIPSEDALFCSSCSSKYQIDYNTDTVVVGLPALTLMQKEGYFYVSN